MIKNINTKVEYEILGQVNFLDENEELKTAYTIVANGETTTVVFPSEEYQLL